MLQISLEDQVVAISGGSRGIGAAAVKLLARAGARVVFSYQTNAQAAREVVRSLPEGQAVAVRIDARRADSGDKLIEAALRQFRRVDIAVANAGIWNSRDLPIASISPKQWDEMVEVNLRGVYSLARAAVVAFRRQQPVGRCPRGRIIAVSSTAGQRGESLHTHYAAAKGGVIAFVRGLATELAPEDIRVNCVAPGWVDTDMSAEAIKQHPERVSKAIPLGRPARPEEIAGCILFLCTPWSDFMTGSVLSANGGAVLA